MFTCFSFFKNYATADGEPLEDELKQKFLDKLHVTRIISRNYF